ncbi:MAG: AraC family transcriptional regulator [Clostridiales bacterium]|nr:AraC family transcriptional regulator [Clostridiales bacterium]
MNEALLSQLRPVAAEEQAILDGNQRIQRELYTSRREFVVDSRKLLEKGQLIEIRPHTRFIHFPRHRHNYVELVYMCSGTTRHILNDTETVTLEEGDLLFLNQGVYHEILPAGREDIAVNFIILPEFFDRAISMIERENVLRDFLLSTLSGTGTDAHYLYIPAKNLLPVQNLMENMVWTLLHGGSNTNTLNQTTMGLLLLNLSQYAEAISRDDPNQREQNLVFLTLKYIDTHYKSGTLAEVSAQLGCPTYVLSRLLTKRAGGSFKDLLQQRKLQQAAYLLANTPLTVEAILDSIGYRNSSYFYRRFREKYGCSPVDYRKRETEKKF